jgi:hypothetical protein
LALGGSYTVNLAVRQKCHAASQVTIKELRRDLAEKFRALRAEVATQVSALANAINAARRP